MRRGKQQITDQQELDTLIRDSAYAVMCLVEGALPYAVPVNIAWDGAFFYAHCARAGKKLDLLQLNPAVTLCFVPEARFVRRGDGQSACSCTMHYRSVLVRGLAEALPPGENEAAREAGLRALAAHFGLQDLAFDTAARAKTTILRIRPEEISGKRNPA